LDKVTPLQPRNSKHKCLKDLQVGVKVTTVQLLLLIVRTSGADLSSFVSFINQLQGLPLGKLPIFCPKPV